MKISTRGRYSLEALLYLALQPAGKKARAVSRCTQKFPTDTLNSFSSLNGLIAGTRGIRAVTLGKKEWNTTVGDILRAVERRFPRPLRRKKRNLRQGTPCIAWRTWKMLDQKIEACIDR